MNELVGSDFHSMMQRYVGMNLLEDEFDEDGNHANQAQPQIEKLVQQAVDTLVPFASPNFTGSSHPRRRMVTGLDTNWGKEMMDLLFCQPLLDAQRNAGDQCECLFFLSGYFRAIFDKRLNRNGKNNLMRWLMIAHST